MPGVAIVLPVIDMMGFGIFSPDGRPSNLRTSEYGFCALRL